ncbi:Clp protease N-terminal domain-containing protein [Catellatospora sp. NPDC049609]|uniref:Clp protease N-terminal domain-containing protein n=1 Tax=Catellatospora sp. NPDC049609 TaxID=3155505 RepID=UPI00341DCE9C
MISGPDAVPPSDDVPQLRQGVPELPSAAGLELEQLVAVAQRYTPAARLALVLAAEQASVFRRAEMGTEHLLLGLLACPATTSAHVLSLLGISADRVDAAVVQVCGRGWLAKRAARRTDPSLRDILAVVAQQALLAPDRPVGTGDLLLALADHDTAGGRKVLDYLGVSADDLRQVLATTTHAEAGHSHVRHDRGRCVHG